MVKLCVILLLAFNVRLIKSQSCNEFKNCGQCIGSELKCVWCPERNHNGSRCISNLNESNDKNWCKSPINPQTIKPNIKKNSPFLSSKDPKIMSVQLRPQSVAIRARVGDTVHFQMAYKPALDYPIDVYYLMDNSYTMSFHKEALTHQALEIYNELKKLSNNVRFGAGTFIEKPALPYADPQVGHRPDTFTNYLSLTDNIEKFIDIVRSVTHSGNYDIQESGLDALMQAMVCDDIKWRREARRMIILATDAPYHSAGDGKMVGAYRPNDMSCHLYQNTYTKNFSLLYDYPSVSQINKVASEKEISITFAVLKQVEQEYLALADKIQGAKCVELKNNNSTESSDLVNLIKDEYLRLVQTLEIDRGAVPSHLDLRISPSCNHTHKCSVKREQSFNLDLYIQIKKCPKINEKSVLKVGPFSLHERLNIEVEVICQCECEEDGKGEKNSPFCNGGTHQCGICKCNKFSYGNHCECKGNSTVALDHQKCKANLNDSVLCSGRGECNCGKCKCSDAFEGNLCEYKANDCPVHENKICGGEGTCKYNTCTCNKGWSGNDCSCTLDYNVCLGANSQICSGNGACKCGECECRGKYSGEFCDSCDTCVEERCKILGAYVECNYNNGKKEACDKKFDVQNQRDVKFLNETEIKAPDWVEANWCKRTLSDESSIVFKYLDKRNYTLILIQKEKELPPEANIWIPIGSAIGAILLIGILTAITWKVLVDVIDSREYKKFMEEASNAGYDVKQNPLYQSPEINFKNPAYTGNCN